MLFISVIFYVFYPGQMLTADYLWKIPLLSLCSVLPALILFSKKEPSRREFIIRRILHFVFTAAVVVGLLILYGWLGVRYLIWFIIFFIVVFTVVTGIGFAGEKKIADKINDKIKNRE
jgi:4-hydroxybenzoate polyprenyltransferase